MIAKDTTITVNFFVTDTDGLPATGQASNITATISINGGTATAISDTITEKGSGWYKFNHLFGTAGNAFIEFSCSGCTIMPWEDDVVELASGSAPSASDIALAVWSYEDENNILYPCRSIQMVEVGNTLYTPMVEGLYGGYDALVNAIWGFNPATLLSQTSAALRLVDIQDNAARPGDAMTLTAAYNAAKTASQFNANTDTVTINSTQAATMVTATGFATPANVTAAQTAIINAMPSTTGLATSSDISTAQTAIINAMPSTSGLATGSDVSTAQAAIIAAMPDISGLSTFDPSNDAVNVSSASITSIQSGLAKTTDLSGLSTFDAANDTVTVESTQAATFVTATGFATPTNVTDAVSALETYGDAHWTGGGGSGGSGITAEDVWKYSGTYGRTLTSSPTDITSLATKTDLTTAQTAIVNAMPSTTGLATSTDVSTAQTAIINAMPSTTGLATSANVSAAQTAIINAMPDVSGLSTFDPTTDEVNVSSASVTSIKSGLSTFDVANDTVTINSEQAAGMVTATGFATPANITAAQTAIINAMPDVSGLSTFDPANDTVVLANTQPAAIASAVWSDTAIYGSGTKANTLSSIDHDVEAIPGQVWMVDDDYGEDSPGTMGQAIYNMFNDHATATDVSVVADLLEEIDAGVLHWSTTATRLTLYKEDNTVLRVYALERDSQGNITRIAPVA